MAPIAGNDICLLETVTYRKAKNARVTGQAASEKTPPSRAGAGYASGGAAVLPLAAVLANWSRIDYLDLDVQAPPCPWSHSPISAARIARMQLFFEPLSPSPFAACRGRRPGA
jgi:hypothetical protein